MSLRISSSAYGCWPKSWKTNADNNNQEKSRLSGLDGKGNDVLTEEITFVIKDLEN